MPIVRVAAWADNVIVDQQSNHVTLVDVFEEFNAPTFPFVVPRLCVFFMVEKRPGDEDRLQGRVVFTSNGAEINQFPVDINFQGRRRNRQILMFGGFLVKEPGVLRSTLYIGADEIGSYEVPVAAVAAPQVEARAG